MAKKDRPGFSKVTPLRFRTNSSETLIKLAERITERLDPEEKKMVTKALVDPKNGRGKRTVNCVPVSDEEMEYTQMVMYDLLSGYRKPRVRSDEELAERIDTYFSECAESGKSPLLEELCLQCGLNMRDFNHMLAGTNRGVGAQTRDILQKARDFMQAFDARMVVANKMQFMTYCFRAKSLYGMHEEMSREADRTAVESSERLTSAQLKEKYMQGIEPIETDYEDKTDK